MATIDKQALLRALAPRAVLKPLSPASEACVPIGMAREGMVRIMSFPYRVGRESRGRMVDGEFVRTERSRPGKGEPNNDLYLVDIGRELQISREHFEIQRTPEGYRLADRGSVCGTSVGAVRTGGENSGGSAPLKDGDTIGVGAQNTPYRFTFITLD